MLLFFCLSFVGFAIFYCSVAVAFTDSNRCCWQQKQMGAIFWRLCQDFVNNWCNSSVSTSFCSVFVGSDMEQTEMVAPELTARSPCYLLVCACCLQFIHLPHFLLAHVPRFGDWSGVLTFSAPPRCSRRHRTAGRIVCFRGVGTRRVQQRFRRTAPCHQHDHHPCGFFVEFRNERRKATETKRERD